MKFGPVPISQAEGAVLAHSRVAGGRKLSKGRILTGADITQMAVEGVREVTVARLGSEDVPENEAAAKLAQALVPDPQAAGLTLAGAFTGRVNLNATGTGVVRADAAAIHAINRIDPAITLATLAPYSRVQQGVLVGTVKIIAYGVDRARLDQACAVARGALSVAPVLQRTAGLLLTTVPGQPDKLNAKGRKVTQARLEALGMTLADVVDVPHAIAPMADALSGLGGDMVLILTGSATSDLHDTAPEALRRAGGEVARFGMPVDPGNLLFTGTLGSRPVIGLPGCARSPALNGADWVLERMACGLEVSDDDIAAMGLGGLLKEIPTRPQPRERRGG